MKNALVAIDRSKSFRIYYADTTNLVKESSQIHGTTPVATAALGRVLTGAGLMAMDLKTKVNKLTLQFKGDGPGQEILASANSRGEVKGYISNPMIILPLKDNGKLDVSGALGEGTLTVIKDIGLNEPYSGKTEIVSGEIAEDLAYYFFMSEQTQTSVALGVKIDVDYSVMGAGGFIIQMLPNAKTEAVDALEKIIREMRPISDMIAENRKPADFLKTLFKGIDSEFSPVILEEREIIWKCDCSRERLEQAVMSIGEKDLTEIIEEDGEAELLCHFCRSSYHFNKSDLRNILEESKKKKR